MVIARILQVAVVVFLVAAVAGTGYWGYQEHQDKNSVLIKAENNYQRAFHDLNNNMTNIEDELGKSIAANSRQLLAPCMANVWRLAYQAQGNIGQLPLNLTPFNKTEEFLGQVAEYTYDIGMRDLEAEPVTEEEWQQLKTLHSQAQEVQGELRRIQSKVLNDQLRWMDVELARASENKDMDKTLMDGMGDIDKQVEGYIETEGDAGDNKLTSETDAEELIDGETISERKAVEVTREFLKDTDIDDISDIDVSRNGEGKDFTSYTVRMELEDRDDVISVDVSKKGGHVLDMLDSRDIEDTDIGLYDGEQKALSFLEERGYESMTNVESDQYDNVGVYDFVYTENDVLIYPDIVRVKVALDNGDIIGYEALDYIVNHEDREIPEPEVSREEAKNEVNANLEVMEEHLSIIETKAGEEALCYEFLGTIENETYRIFINAQTGEEERIDKMKKAEPMV
jgi:spore germination protein